MAVKNFIVDNDIDVLAMTETWLRPGTDDSVEIGTLCPTGYRVINIPRSHSAAGGVGIIFKNSIRLNTSLTDQYHSFDGFSPSHCVLCKNSACLLTTWLVNIVVLRRVF